MDTKVLVGQDSGAYTFDASAKTVTMTGLPLLALENILLITNVTTGDRIYLFDNAVIGGVLTGIAGNQVLTLDFDTTAMADTDSLQIWVINPAVIRAISASSLPLPTGASTAANQATEISGLSAILTELGQKLEPADLASLATSANQTTANTSLSAIDTKLGNLTHTEDDAHVSGDKGILALGVRKDIPSATAGSDNDNQSAIYDSTGRMWARSVSDRPSSGSNRTSKKFNLSNQTADALAYTVTAGKTLYLKLLVVSCYNTSTVAAGVLEVKDGTTGAGTLQIPYLMAPAGIAASSAVQGIAAAPIVALEPIQFTSGVFADITSGAVTYSIFGVGYEETN